MTIHKEGYSILIAFLVILAATNVTIVYFFKTYPWVYTTTATASIIFYLLILQFFRSPKVNTPVDANNVIAPADGKVVVIEQITENEYFHAPRKQVSIFMSPLNVHVNRNPISGNVQYVKYHEGKYLVAWHPKSSMQNERNTVVIKNENGFEILSRQIAGALAKRIKCYIKAGDQVKQGTEMGFIKFGSRVDIFLPTDVKIHVTLGQKTIGGETTIATFNQ